MNDDQLLQWLHEGMFEAPMWDRFLNRLMTTTGARLVTLAVRPADDAQAALRQVSADGPRQDLPAALLAELFANERLRVGRVYDLTELAALIEPDARAAAGNWLEGEAISRWRGIKVAGDEASRVWLSCGGGSAVGPSTGALLTVLAPHLKIAMRNFAERQREQLRSAITGDAFSRLRVGWFALDAQCRIIDLSDDMQQMLQWGGPLRRGRYGRLVPESADIDRRLALMLRNLGHGLDVRPQAFRLSPDPWIDMLVTPASARIFIGSRPATAIAYVRSDHRSQTDRCEQLEQLFGLLPSEARLAWQLAQATSIAVAAQSLGLTVETARNYSKKIYAKTGARGQADLVRIITTSVLAFH